MTPRRRGATDLSGIVLIDKPAGLTSHDVVAAVRRATGEGRVGHAGTLDPMATGLLVVLVGPATRLEPHLAAADKTYEATIAFGTRTDTGDAEGTPIAEQLVPSGLETPAAAEAVLTSFLGDSMQTPPAYSAIKVDGKTAHREARQGRAVELAPRPIRVTRAELVNVQVEPLRWDVVFTVSKGTYIRSLAEDIGVAAGTVAHLSALRRTGSGGLDISGTRSLEEVASLAQDRRLDEAWADPFAALGMPRLDFEASAIADGRTLDGPLAEGTAEGDLVAIGVDGDLAAVYRARQGRYVPEALFARPAKGAR